MPLCECAARPGFQISLESNRTFLISGLHDNVDAPRSSGRRMRATSSVVGRKSRGDVRCQPRVVARWLDLAFQNVDEALAGGHVGRRGAKQLPSEGERHSEDFPRRPGLCTHFLHRVADKGGRVFSLCLYPNELDWLANRSTFAVSLLRWAPFAAVGTSSLGLPPVARSRSRRAKGGGPDQCQLEPHRTLAEGGRGTSGSVGLLGAMVPRTPKMCPASSDVAPTDMIATLRTSLTLH